MIHQPLGKKDSRTLVLLALTEKERQKLQELAVDSRYWEDSRELHGYHILGGLDEVLPTSNKQLAGLWYRFQDVMRLRMEEEHAIDYLEWYSWMCFYGEDAPASTEVQMDRLQMAVVVSGEAVSGSGKGSVRLQAGQAILAPSVCVRGLPGALVLFVSCEASRPA
jgi:mannose-6-phosphate isomerase-like protein (cupin superfamily)